MPNLLLCASVLEALQWASGRDVVPDRIAPIQAPCSVYVPGRIIVLVPTVFGIITCRPDQLTETLEIVRSVRALLESQYA